MGTINSNFAILMLLLNGMLFCSADLQAEPFATDSTEKIWTSEQLEHFEKRIRPLLSEHCQECHGTEQQEGGLRLDARSALLKGGDTGPAIVPGHPEQSELILAISYDPDGYQMPPDGKLPAEAIALLTDWVRDQAPWPAETEQMVKQTQAGVPLTRDHWSLKPLTEPAIPPVTQPEWTSNPVDHFLLARLEAEGITPAETADREVLLRRACFDLLGLPPTLAQREQFLQDDRPEAWSDLIDQLLASPAYGERWARHWLDLVRYAETMGHEFDFEIPLAWKYRDYLIRAFNDDVPLDQLTREHIAGDLLQSPRVDPATGYNDSILGTGFFWLGQGKHSPVDVRAEQCDLIDNQIDVLTKMFLGTTVACARCHDHKFDPITIKDYYAMSGILESSRRHETDLRPQQPLLDTVAVIHDWKRQHRQQLLKTLALQLEELLNLLATKPDSINPKQPEFQSPAHPLAPWISLREMTDEQNFARQKQEWINRLQSLNGLLPAESTLLADFRNGLPVGWITSGLAFGWADSEGDVICGPNPWKPIEQLVPAGQFRSDLASGKAYGVLRSPTFVIDAPYLDYLVGRSPGKLLTAEFQRGPLKNGQIHLVVDGFHHIRNPIYGGLSLQIPHSDQPQWLRQNVEKWIGHRAYIEIYDEEEGGIQLEQVVSSRGVIPSHQANSIILKLLADEQINNAESLWSAYLQQLRQLVFELNRITESGELSLLTDDQTQLINVWLKQIQVVEKEMSAPEWLDQFYVKLKSLEAELGTPVLGLTTTEGTPLNSPLLVRGNSGKPAAEIPRRAFEVLADAAADIPVHSSGRLQLAEFIVSAQNPLFDRVLVNRIWRAHFGEGLVTSPDDFGKMGSSPSHPELLDYLAIQFRQHGRSLKWLHRLLMTSSAYRMSSRYRADIAERDPQNRLWHRMLPRRLEGEAIRDAMLLVSGRLNAELYGPPVLPHLTPFMQGRGRPGVSGPVDGNGRRSIYINVRRNFITPLFLAFDYPLPLTTTGRRSVSNVPAQALSLMNSDFVTLIANDWASQTLKKRSVPTDQIELLYLEGLGRKPTSAELTHALNYLQTTENQSQTSLQVLTDFCHVLMNVKEFIYIH